jgi:hypothetical protein
MGTRRFRWVRVAAWLPLAGAAAGCTGAGAVDGERVGRTFLIRPASTNSPGPYRLYSDATGAPRMVDDGIIRFQAEGTCILYEAERRTGAVWLIASEDDRRPYEVARAKSPDPWYLEPVGLRRYRRTVDGEGRAVIAIETLTHAALCMRAAAQLGFGGVSPVAAVHLSPEIATVSVTSVDASGNTALHDAATFGTEGLVRALVNAGVPVDARNSSGSTALHVAAIFEQPAVIERLITAGADVDARNAAGFTPLMYAARLESATCARLLVESGANTALQNGSGLTPIQLARGARADEVASFLGSLKR